jgi:hypothetical protein
MGLLALAMIPIALMVAAAFAVLALGTTLIRAFIPVSLFASRSKPRPVFHPREDSKAPLSAIDVEYEVKDPK